MLRKFGRSLTATMRTFTCVALIGSCGGSESEDEDQASGQDSQDQPRIRDQQGNGENDKDDSPCRGPAFTFTSQGLGLTIESTSAETDEAHDDQGNIGIDSIYGQAPDGLIFDFQFPTDPKSGINLPSVRGVGEFPGWQWLRLMRDYSSDLGCTNFFDCCRQKGTKECTEWSACSGTVTVTAYNPYLVGTFEGTAIEEFPRDVRPYVEECAGKGQAVAGSWSGTFCFLNDIFASP